MAGEYSKYYTGEAYWALARLHRAFPAEGGARPPDRIGAYLASSRDEAEDHWPPIPDHWAAYGPSETVEFPERGRPPLTDDELDYARRQAELFGIQAASSASIYGPWGRWCGQARAPRRLVRRDGRGAHRLVADHAGRARLADLRAPIAERAACVAGLAVERAVRRRGRREAARPGRVEGAWFVDGETRMDDQQHALAGLLRTIPIVEAARIGPDDGTHRRLAVGRRARAGAQPGPGRVRGPSRGALAAREVALAAAGGAIGGLVVCAAALRRPAARGCSTSASRRSASPPGSWPSWSAPPTCSGGRRRPEPALDGRRAALIPVAVPVVARPALLVLALGAGADLGVLVCAGAMGAACRRY